MKQFLIMTQPGRRLFLKQASLATLGTALHTKSFSQENMIAVASNRPSGVLPIAFDDIYIQGELLSRAMRNYDRLESDLYWPENDFAPKGRNPNAASPGDKEGRIILALTMQARATHRRPVYLDQIINLIPKYVNKKGYLGPILTDKIDEQQIGGHGWLLRGLCEYYFWKKDSRAKQHILNIINHLALPVRGAFQYYPVDPQSRIPNVGEAAGTIQNTVGKWMLSSDIGCFLLLLDGTTQVYQLFPSAELKGLIEEMIACFARMDLVGIKAQTHSVLTGLRALLRYYSLTQEPQLLQQVERSFEIYRTVGMTANYENLNWFERPTWTEPCAIIDSYMVAVQLWQLTGKTQYLEDAHRIYYNAICHTQRTNGGFGLDNCVRHEEPSLYVKDDEAWWCCTMRGGEGLAMAIRYNYFIDNNEVIVPFFNSSESILRLNKGTVALKQISEYPFNGLVSFEVQDSDNVHPVVIQLFAPSWTKNHQIKINDQEYSFTRKGLFIQVKTTLKKGTVISYRFDQSLEIRSDSNLSHGNHEHHSIAYGVLQLGYEGDTEISLNTNSKITREDTRVWQIENTNFKLTPIYHFMDPRVEKNSGYRKQMLFRSI